MSVFSERLNKIIQEKHLTLQYLEKESGFSLALISKIKTGKRLPETEDKMLCLIKALHCSIEQEESLIKDYRIEKLGREQYLCMEECRKILEAISDIPAPFLAARKSEYVIYDQQVIRSQQNIYALVQYIIDLEIQQPDSFLKMIIQPDCTFLTDYLFSCASLVTAQHSTFQIEHIIALHDDAITLSGQKNIQITGICLRLSSVFGKDYRAYCHYKTDFTSDLFPFFILSSQCGILISTDCQTALFFQEPDTLNALDQMFASLKSKSNPLFKLQHTPTEFLQSYQDVYQSDIPVRSVAEVSYMPCIVPNIPPRIAMKRLNPLLTQTPFVMDSLKTYWSNLSYIKSIKIISAFSLKGLELFMQTGICYELPKDCLTPFSMEERIEILKGFWKDCLAKNMVPILLKDNRLNISPELYLTVYNDTNVSFLWNPQSTAFSSCSIQESGMKKSLIDFQHYIHSTSEDTYSEEESLDLIRDFCSQYFPLP